MTALNGVEKREAYLSNFAKWYFLTGNYKAKGKSNCIQTLYTSW